MNDLETQIRDTLRRHEDEAPLFDASDVRRASMGTRRRQMVNLTAVGIGTVVVVIGLVAGLGGILRADLGPTVLDQPPSVVNPEPSVSPSVAGEVRGWPDLDRNPAGTYSWDGSACDPSPRNSCNVGFMHNGYKPGSGDVNIMFEGEPGQLIPHKGKASTVAGLEGTYRRFIGDYHSPGNWMNGLPIEEWMVDIKGTTITIHLIAKPGAPETELAEAHEIISSLRAEPRHNDLGFRLLFTLATNTWDSG